MLLNIKTKKTIIDYVFKFVSGFFVGAANVIPGISGGTILAISNQFEILVKNFRNLLTFKVLQKQWWVSLVQVAVIIAGVGVGVVVFAIFTTHLIDNYKDLTYWIIVILLTTSIIIYINKYTPNLIGHVPTVFVSAAVPILLAILNKNGVVLMGTQSPLIYFIVGIIAAAAMILPGISGSMIFLILGVYKDILDKVKEFEIKTLALIGSGAIIGMVASILIIDKAYKSNKERTEAAIFGLIFGSIFAIVIMI